MILGAVHLSIARLLLAAGAVAGQSTSYPSLAFSPDPREGPEAVLLDGPVKGLTRVVFQPERTRGFPEELRPLRDFPAPAPGIVGLAVSGDCLWAACSGPARIFRMERSSGSVLDSFPAPGPRPGALHWDGMELWHADRSGKVFAMDAGGAVRAALAVGFEPAAIARDGPRLLLSDAMAARLHILDAASGVEVSSEPAPEKGLAGLAGAGEDLWCASGSEIIRFDRRRGLPVCGFGVSPPHPARCLLSGLARDHAELWYADGAAGSIRSIREPRHGEFVASGGRERREQFTITYRNRSAKPWEDPEILQHVPFLEMPGHRYLSLSIDPSPRALYRDDLGNVSALLNLGRVEPGRSAVVRIEVGLWTADRRQVVDPALFPGAEETPERREYLSDFYPITGGDDRKVREFLLRAVGEEKNPYWKVRMVHDALCQAVRYQEAGTESVSEVLEKGYGVCRNYSAAMQAFGRMLGVPVLNSWAPRHETCFWMLPGIAPSLMEVTADAADREPSSQWARCRWLLGTHRDEITTGVRGRAMHSRLLIAGQEFTYGWHFWRPSGLDGLAFDGGWKVLEGRPRITRRF